MKKVAIITRTKNRPIMLPRVLISIKRQTFKDFTWVIVNDAGNKDPVDDIAIKAKAAGINVLLIHRDKSIGMEAASNDGIRRSKSKYIVIHDDDDTWEKAFLSKTVSYLDQNNDAPGVITWTNRVNESMDDNRITFLGVEPYNHDLKAIYLADLAIVNRFSPISFLFRRIIYEKVGGFDESLPVLGDWDFNLKVLMEGDIHVLPYVLANYHVRVNLNDKSDSYGNSLTSGIEKHILYDASYRNRKLREDLKNGNNGIGMILTHGQMLRHLNGQSYRLSFAIKNNRFLNIARKVFKI